jgi:hypothetical protein
VLLSLASAVTLRSKSRRTRDHILLFHLRIVSLFVASYDSPCNRGRILNRLLTRVQHRSKVKVILDRRSFCQSVLVSGHYPRPATNSSFTSMDDRLRNSQFSSCAAPSLMRKRIWNVSLQLPFCLASAVTLRSKTRRTLDHILLSHLRLGSLSVASYYSQGCVGGFYPASTRAPAQRWHSKYGSRHQ